MRSWLTAISVLCVLGLPANVGLAAEAAAEGMGLRILVVRTEAEARAAVAAVAAGAAFEQLVREQSIGPARDQGGYLGRVDPAGLSPAARAALARVRRGQVSPIFRTEEGFAVIQVLTEREEQERERRMHGESEAQRLLTRGTELGQQGDLEGAVRTLQRAVELDPDLADAHFNLAIAYRKLGRPDAAIEAMRGMIRLQPNDFEARMGLGAWLSEQARHAEASVQHERAALLRLQSREAWLRLGQSYEAEGRAQAAAGAYRRVLGLPGPDDPALWEALLRAAVRAKDGPAAVEAARKIKTLRPGHDGFLVLGEALLLNGDAGAAAQELEKAVALAPNSAPAQAGLGVAYARLGQTEAAAEHLLRAVQLEPENPKRYQAVARLQAEAGRLDLAIVALRDGVAAASGAPRALQAELVEELAALYERAGMGREAARERLRLEALRAP